MRSRAVFVLLAGCAACSGAPDPTDTDVEDDGACGAVTTWDVTIIGTVVDGDGEPVEGAAVNLEDRGWDPGTILGESSTDVNGDFEFVATDVTSVEDCWGTILDYVLVAEEGERSGERDMNTPLYNAIYEETLVVDISGAPIEIE